MLAYFLQKDNLK